MKSIYLIQRAEIRKDYVKGGIDSLLNFDYMGSAEFEFGALPFSYATICKFPRKFETFTVDGEEFTILYLEGIHTPEDIEKIKNTFLGFNKEQYGGRTKEHTYFYEYTHRKDMESFSEKGLKGLRRVYSEYSYRNNCWWDVENHFIIFPSIYLSKFTQAIDSQDKEITSKFENPNYGHSQPGNWWMYERGRK